MIIKFICSCIHFSFVIWPITDNKYNWKHYSSRIKACCGSINRNQMLSWESLSIRLLGMSFVDCVAPFTERKGFRIPTQSAIETNVVIANAQSTHEKDIIFHRSLWSVWFGSAEGIGSPKPHSCIWACPTKSWSCHLDLLSSWRRKDPQLPRRVPSWTHIWDIKEFKQLQKESVINYVSQIAFSVGPALFRPWARHSMCDLGRFTGLSYTYMGAGGHQCHLEEPHFLQEKRA